MATQPSDVQAFQQAVDADPQLQQIIAKAKADKRVNVGKAGAAFWAQYEQQINNRLAELGIQPPQDYRVDPTTGQAQHLDFFDRHPYLSTALLGAGIVGGGALASGALGGGAAGANVALQPTLAQLGATGAGTTAAAAAPTVAAAATPSIWHSILGPAIGAGAGVAGAVVQSKAATDAAKTEAASADKAMQLQKEIAQQQRADLAPYYGAGVGALSALGQGLGIDITPPASYNTGPLALTPTTPSQTATSGTAVPSGSIASLKPPSMQMPNNPALGTEPMVRIKAPNGQRGQVPQSKVQQALAAGGSLQ